MSNPIILDIISIIANFRSSGSKITFYWIPSHIGITGNETVDKLATDALTNPQAPKFSNILAAPELIAAFRGLWWPDMIAHLHSLSPSLNCTSRTKFGPLPWHHRFSKPTNTALFRLRSGHNKLLGFYSKIDKNLSDDCLHGCLSKEDTNHVLFVCPHLVKNLL